MKLLEHKVAWGIAFDPRLLTWFKPKNPNCWKEFYAFTHMLQVADGEEPVDLVLGYTGVLRDESLALASNCTIIGLSPLLNRAFAVVNESIQISNTESIKLNNFYTKREWITILRDFCRRLNIDVLSPSWYAIAIYKRD